MKKILTLLLSIGLFSASFAQSKHHKNDNYNRNHHYARATAQQYPHQNDRRYYDNRNVSYSNQRAEAIQKINRVYNYKVMSIQNNRYMKKRQKKAAIHDLQKERARQIQMVNKRFAQYGNNHKYHKGRK
jgi:hypothetical protein